ncbi:reverse transcriptase domain-containing protein [Tanacetum coccineum]
MSTSFLSFDWQDMDLYEMIQKVWLLSETSLPLSTAKRAFVEDEIFQDACPNPYPSTPFVPPSRSDWDLLFQLCLNESLSVGFHAPEVIAPTPEEVAPDMRAKKTVPEPNSPDPNSYQLKLPYPERMKVKEKDTPSAQQSMFMKLFKQLRLEIGLKDALIEMPKFNKWTNAFADFGASINLLPHSIYKQLGLGALKPTRMTLELANRSVTHPMGIAEDVVVRVDGFTFLADFVVVNFEPDPRVPIILGRPFLRTAKALIDLYEEKLTLRVGSDELVFYAEKSEKSKNKQFAHAISVIDFSKDEPFSGSTTNHSDALPPSSSPVKTSDNLEEFADELTLLKKGVHEENFQVYSNPLFEFDDNFNSSNVNPLFNEMDEDVENENSNVSDSDEPVLLNTPLSNKVECFDPEDNIDEITVLSSEEVSSILRKVIMIR